MIDAKQARYADLIECCARSLAFDGLTGVALPKLVSELTSEAIDLRNGWADFSASAEVGTADLPIVDTVIFEVLARATALRDALIGNGRHVAPNDAGAFTLNGQSNIAHAVATQMREHLAALRTRQLRRRVGA